jgi:hypothetical protein
MKSTFTTISAIALSLSASAVSAATLTIDTFDVTTQFVMDDPFAGLSNVSEVAAPEAIGGYREMAVETTPSSFNGSSLGVNTVVGGVGDGLVTFDNGNSNLFSFASLIYDGMDGAPTGPLKYNPVTGLPIDDSGVNTTGLGGVDLTNGGATNAFRFDVATVDPTALTVGAFTFTVSVWDQVGGESHYTEGLVTGFSPLLGFNEFQSFVGGGADFTNVGAIAFSIAGEGAPDGALSSITVVPLPASAWLLLGGLGGLAGVSAASKRRRRKS